MTSVPTNHGLRALARGAAVLAAALATAAAAQPASQIDVNAGSRPAATKTLAVSTRGLDLSTGHGRKALDHRIKVAAARVCDVWEISWDHPQADFTRCFTAALEGGRAQAAERSASSDGAPIAISAS